jgi:hypothetical protein
MSDDLIARARRALQPVPDRAKGAELLARAHAALAVSPATGMRIAAAPPRQSVRPGKLLVAIDATASRLMGGWEATKALQDRVLKLLPAQFEVALAAYGGDLHTLTPFTSNRRKLRALAARIECEGGTTRLLEILARLGEGVGAVIYITDTFEECRETAVEHAVALRARGTRLFVLFDSGDGKPAVDTHVILASMATHTGGAALPFSASGLRELLRYLNGSIVGAYRYEQ